MRQYQLEGQMSLFDFMTDSSDRVEEKQWTGFITFTFEPDREEEPEEIPVWHNIKQEPHQYKITDDMLGWGTKREKYRANVNAIRVLKQCEKQSRLATLEEQEILAKYVGWGGLSEVFSNHSQWKQEYIEIKEILTDTEYGSAKRSTLTAFYTPPIVIRAIYKVPVRMGLKNGNILEPSCGIGNFIGLLPHDLEKCKVYGVELDSISGRIAKQLYQKSDITVCGFENADYPDNFFDAVVGNIPFGQIKIKDARYDKMNLSIHDYFIVKALDKVRPGGVIVLLTSSWTMDKEKPFVRKYIAERAELIGAVRLPNNTFQKNAGTDITADILFFQKRDHVVYEDPKWLVLGEDANGILQNRYFIDHPEMILGTMAVRSTQYGEKSICKPSKEDDLEKLLDGALSNIKGKIREYESRAQSENGDDGVIPADEELFVHTV